MKTKKLTFIVVLFTMVCVCIMLYSNKKAFNEENANKNPETKNVIKEINKPSVNSDGSNAYNKTAGVKEVSQQTNQIKLNKKEESVFRVSKGTVEEMLSVSDLLKIEEIASKLPASDYARIEEYLQNGDDESIIKALNLLKNRLSEKDYENLITVVGKFINMDVIDGQ